MYDIVEDFGKKSTDKNGYLRDDIMSVMTQNPYGSSGKERAPRRINPGIGYLRAPIQDSDSTGKNKAPAVFSEAKVTVPISPWEEEFGWRVEKHFWEYFNKSEDPEGWNRRWNIENDVPWKDVAQEPMPENGALMIETFFAVESYLPDFAEKGLTYYRSMVGLSNSHINWSYEELKHGHTLQLILERSSARTPEQMKEFRTDLARNGWTLPYSTPRQMLVYAAFQEKETQRNYELLGGFLKDEGALGAAKGLRIIGRDEAFHHAFYKDLVKMLLEYDEVGTAQDIQTVAHSFKMPAQHLIPDMRKRLVVMARNKVFGRDQIRDEAIIPTIREFGFRDPDELASVAGKLVDPEGNPLPASENSLTQVIKPPIF